VSTAAAAAAACKAAASLEDAHELNVKQQRLVNHALVA
jgi:hypothetical protein